jgi:hypothetical protein
MRCAQVNYIPEKSNNVYVGLKSVTGVGGEHSVSRL